MKILAVTHEASRTGAVKAFVAALAPLRDLADDLVVVAKVGGPMLEDMRRVSTRVLVTPHPRVSSLRRLARISPAAGIAPVIERRVASLVMASEEPDLVYASTVLSSEYVSAASARGIPAVLHVHEIEPLTSWGLARGGVRPGMCHAVVPCQYAADQMAAAGLPVAAVLRGPFAAVTSHEDDPGDLPWQVGTHRLVACATAGDWKGTEEWLQAAQLLPRLDGKPVQWVWLGGGPQLEALRARTRALDLSDTVTWLGERSDPRPYLRSADLLVLPTRSDSAPLVVLEAATVGTASVAFDVGGLSEMLVDPRAIVTAGDVDALVNQVSAALRSPELREILLRAIDGTLELSRVERFQRDLATVAKAAHRV